MFQISFFKKIEKIFVVLIHDCGFVYTSCVFRWWSYLFRREMPLVFNGFMLFSVQHFSTVFENCCLTLKCGIFTAFTCCSPRSMNRNYCSSCFITLCILYSQTVLATTRIPIDLLSYAKQQRGMDLDGRTDDPKVIRIYQFKTTT